MTKKPSKLEAINLDAYYGDFHALKSINIAMEEKAVTAFIGPSGCGKSTFLRTFNRMNDYIDGFHIDGQILLDGRDIYEKDIRVDELRKEVGMVFQKPNPFPKSIFENVVYGLRIQGIKDKKILQEAGVPEGKEDPRLAEIFGQYVERCATMFTAKELVSTWAGAYGKGLSDSELKQILAYYRSPLGKKDVQASQVAMASFAKTMLVESEKRVNDSVVQLMSEIKVVVGK